jgi:drug/metabolite transporter (DMT)-like permease
VTRSKYLVLVSVMVLAAFGDVSLSRGMKDQGAISLHHWTQLFSALASPWVLGGIVLLIGFMASYLTALSWADLTYVLPASALSYIILAGLSRLLLHENVTPRRWLGIILITAGVGFVASGPSLTLPHGKPLADSLIDTPELPEEASPECPAMTAGGER